MASQWRVLAVTGKKDRGAAHTEKQRLAARAAGGLPPPGGDREIKLHTNGPSPVQERGVGFFDSLKEINSFGFIGKAQLDVGGDKS